MIYARNARRHRADAGVRYFIGGEDAAASGEGQSSVEFVCSFGRSRRSRDRQGESHRQSHQRSSPRRAAKEPPRPHVLSPLIFTASTLRERSLGNGAPLVKNGWRVYLRRSRPPRYFDPANRPRVEKIDPPNATLRGDRGLRAGRGGDGLHEASPLPALVGPSFFET